MAVVDPSKALPCSALRRATDAYVDIASAPLAVAGRVSVEKELGGEYFGPGWKRKFVSVHSYYAAPKEGALFGAVVTLRDENDPEVHLQSRIFAPKNFEFGLRRRIAFGRGAIKCRAPGEKREHRCPKERLVHT